MRIQKLVGYSLRKERKVTHSRNASWTINTVGKRDVEKPRDRWEGS